MSVSSNDQPEVDSNQSARRSHTQQEAMVEAGMLLASELALPRVLQRLVELATQFTGARYGALGVLAGDGSIGEFITVGLSDSERQAIGDPPKGRGVLGLLIKDPAPLRVDRIQEHPESVGFPPHHPRMTSFLGAPVRAQGRVFGNLYLTEKVGGGSFDAADEQLLTTLAGQAGVAIANSQSFEELRQRERWLQALHAINSAMLSGGSTEALHAAIVKVAREMTDSVLSAVVRPRDGDPRRLWVTAVDGRGAHRLEHLELPASGTASHAVMRSGRPRLLETGSAQAAWFAKAGVDIGPLMVVPLTVRQRTEGTILIARGLGASSFRQEDLSLVDSFASQAALAIDYLQIQEQLQHLAVLQERQRIARDIHDDPVQAVIYLARRLEFLAAAPELTGLAARQLEQVRSLAVAVADGLRQLTEGLRSETLEEHGIGPALTELGQRFEGRSGVRVEVRTTGDVTRWPEALERGWLRIAQEAISNVERHAGASRVGIRVDQREGRLRMAIQDDGVGFRARKGRAPQEGLGMLGMRERAQLLGGSLWVRSRPGRGTLVVVRVGRDAVNGEGQVQPHSESMEANT
ncbi:MAG: sensor histidine kinase [Candidatus Dormibacteria bacterium]